MQSYLLECLPAALGGWPDINIYDMVNQYIPAVSAVVSPAFGTHTHTKMVALGSTIQLNTATAHQLNSNTTTTVPTALPPAPTCAVMERADSGAPDPAPPAPLLQTSLQRILASSHQPNKIHNYHSNEKMQATHY